MVINLTNSESNSAAETRRRPRWKIAQGSTTTANVSGCGRAVDRPMTPKKNKGHEKAAQNMFSQSNGFGGVRCPWMVVVKINGELLARRLLTFHSVFIVPHFRSRPQIDPYRS